MQYLAFDVGGTGIKHALIDHEYGLSERGSFPTAGVTTTEQFIEALGAIHDRVVGQVAGVAVSTCGELDPVSGHMFSGGSLAFNSGVNLVELLQARCHTRVSVENDANCALLAELHHGSLADVSDAIALVFGTGVGGAVMLGRRIHHGSHFHAGNASFTLTALDEPYDVSRLLGLSSGVGGLARAVAARNGLDPAAVDGRTVFDLVDAGDDGAREVLATYCARLARFIYNTQVMLDVEVVAIGGGISARASFIETLSRAVDDVFDASVVPLPRPEVRACRHRNDANLIGALYHHLHPTGA